jgi:hypothetical protein
MKFRACFSDVGVAWLEKRFLPAFEKASPGRALELTLLLTPDSVFLIHDAKAAGGPEIHADFAVRPRALLFRAGGSAARRLEQRLRDSHLCAACARG